MIEMSSRVHRHLVEPSVRRRRRPIPAPSLTLLILLVLLGFPIAFTLLAMGVGFGYYAYYQGGIETVADIFNNNIFFTDRKSSAWIA